MDIAIPKAIWTRTGIQWLKALGQEQHLRDTDALRRDLLSDELGEVNGKIKRVEIELGKIAAKHPGVQLLMTILGVGPPTVRKMLCEAAWQAIRRSPTVRQWFDQIVGNDPDRRKIAAVAVARKLVVVMGAMLRSGEAWREHEVKARHDVSPGNKMQGQRSTADGCEAPLRKTP